jgi:hypothetical protein
MTLTGATVFIGIATSVLAVGSWIAAVYAIRAYRKQAEEVRTIKDEAVKRGELIDQQTEVLKEQKQWFIDEHTERRRAQACMVFITTEAGPDPRRTEEQLDKGVPWHEGVTAHVKNTSAQPVYDLTIDWRQGTASWGEPDCVSVLIPGAQEDRTRIYPEELPANVDPAVFSAVARFRDAGGVKWLIRPDGNLSEEIRSRDGTTAHA